jgi:hypothetical protein
VKYALDTEFLDLPAQVGVASVDLLSVGLVCEDGRDLHVAVRKPDGWWDRPEVGWLRENVLPTLPEPVSAYEAALAVRGFVDGDPTFYAYVGAYDWVGLMSLFGPLISRPGGWPMHYVELKDRMREFAMRYGVPPRVAFPREDGTEHTAVDDARWNMVAMRRLGIVR